VGRAGDRSAEEHLARKAGTSRGAARSEWATSKRLRRLPNTEAALRRGELSRAQAETIADANAVNPADEQTLLKAARTGNLMQLREQANRAKAAGNPRGLRWRRRRERPAPLHRRSGAAPASKALRRGRTSPWSTG